MKPSKGGKRLIVDINRLLEESRILSVKEPMQLSDRVNLNTKIRGIQILFGYLTEEFG